LVISLALHLMLVVFVPSLESDPVEDLPILQIEILPPKEPEPVSIPAAEPEPAPEPPKPVEKPKPEPKKIKPLPEPAPIETYEPPSEVVPPEPATNPAPVMAVEPTVQQPPVFTAPLPPPEPPIPTGPTQADLDAARSRYGSLLAREIAKHKLYPRVAQMRGWQGEAIVDLKLDGSGNVLSSTIETSSGFEVLDKQALEMVKKASPFPKPPDILSLNTFNILVPVSFKLE
jgi:periplasmic protein TonB